MKITKEIMDYATAGREAADRRIVHRELGLQSALFIEFSNMVQGGHWGLWYTLKEDRRLR
jgi:hypothetical protein